MKKQLKDFTLNPFAVFLWMFNDFFQWDLLFFGRNNYMVYYVKIFQNKDGLHGSLS